MSLFAMVAASDSTDMGLGNAVAFAKNLLRFLAAPNSGNLNVGKPSIPMIQPVVMASLYAGIFVVLVLRSYAQVLGIHARRVIANMHDDLVGRNLLATKEFVRVAMRPYSYLSRHQKNPIPVRVALSLPEPAGRGLFYSAFKNIVGRKNWIVEQPSIRSDDVVAGSTKLSSNRFRIFATNASDCSSGLIGHSGLHERASIICHIHGGG